jgi:hypothetical protein
LKLQLVDVVILSFVSRDVWWNKQTNSAIECNATC